MNGMSVNYKESYTYMLEVVCSKAISIFREGLMRYLKVMPLVAFRPNFRKANSYKDWSLNRRKNKKDNMITTIMNII
jgi:hypothetical protein